MPRELVSLPMPKGLNALKSKVIELNPANATADTSYGPVGQRRIMFNIPAYPAALLQTSRSFLSFRGKVKAGATADNAKIVALKDGVPVIERLVVRSGTGVLLEDIRDYHIFERVMSNFDDWSHKYADAGEMGDYRAVKEAAAIKSNLFKLDTGR